MHRGLSIAKLSEMVERKMKAGYSNAVRLVRTEMNYVNNQGHYDSMIAAEVAKYEFIATLDNRTSQKCRHRDGEIFHMSEKEVGENYPPLHARCRSTVAPFIEGTGRGGTRIAKVGKKTIEIPAAMRYADYEKVYIKKEMSLAEWKKGNSVSVSNKINMTNNENKMPDLNYNLTVRRQVQNRHIEGTAEYQQYVEKLSELGLKPSKLNTDVDVQALIKEFHKKGKYDPNPQDNSPREIVDVGKNVGQYWDIEMRKFVNTSFVKIVYSKKGTHIYPIKPRGDER